MTVLSPPRPKLRPIDIRPYAHNGRASFILRDPARITDGALVVPRTLAAVLAFCDGEHTAAQMAVAYRVEYGVRIDVDVVEHLLVALDEACLLDNEHAAAARRQALAEYRNAPYRPMLIAGQGYPADPGELATILNTYVNQARRGRNGAPIAPNAMDGAVFGLLSPHIDYPRGGAVYAQVWDRAAAALQSAELVILFGTDHHGNDPFTLTRQSYATPYGVLPTDQGIVDALAAVLGEDAAFAGELRHRGEHSLELVAVWLHHMRGGKSCPVVPILTGSLHPYLKDNTALAANPAINAVLDVLAAACAGRRVAVVASGDLAHVGPAFGGEPLDAAARADVCADDEALLACMAAGDPAAFFAAISRVADRNNVCGVAPIYLMLRLLGEQLGNVVGEQASYAVCPADDYDTSAVTVTGMVFHQR